jgi:hypothetical protein
MLWIVLHTWFLKTKKKVAMRSSTIKFYATKQHYRSFSKNNKKWQQWANCHQASLKNNNKWSLELQLIIVKYPQKTKENRNQVPLGWQRHVVGGKGKMKGDSMVGSGKSI